jgi:23S rRNA G2445 N2-methylase RlmL
VSVELRHGEWQRVLADVECDALICDPPYSDRTHAGHDSGTRSDGSGDSFGHRRQTRAINYGALSADEARAFVDSWTPRVRGWMCIMTDHVLAPVFADAMTASGRYTFAPLPCVDIGSRVRLSGDGPSSWTCWLVVSRPSTRAFQRWGTLAGAYVTTGHGDRVVMGGKRLDTMRAIVRDYSRPGDVVCDPCAGGATTLIAALMEGRKAIGAERSYATAELASYRIERALAQQSLFAPTAHVEPVQEVLFDAR